MSTKTLLSRRQALMLSGAAAASVAIGGLSRVARGAPSAAPSLPIPTLIDARNGETVSLSLQNSRHRFGAVATVASRGISSSYLGPVVRVRSGDTIPFRVENQLNEDTTLHWHGLMVPSQVDGGPHNTIKPSGIWTPEITIKQPPATTWFHPHLHGNTARQVYSGLAGMMIISDGADVDRGLPHTNEIMASDAMKAIFAKLRQMYDFVIVDLPPLAPVVDVRSSTHLVDSFIFVVEWGATKIDVVSHALHRSQIVQDRLLGVVLNKVDIAALGRFESHRGNYYHNKYYSRYGYVE